MAHSCPNCGCACHCNGDIDDIVLEDRDAENRCTCCPDPDADDEPVDDEAIEECSDGEYCGL